MYMRIQQVRTLPDDLLFLFFNAIRGALMVVFNINMYRLLFVVVVYC